MNIIDSKLESLSQTNVGDLFTSSRDGHMLALVYLSAPAIVFLMTFIQPAIGIAASILVAAAVIQNLIKKRDNNLPPLAILVPFIGCLTLLWIVGFVRDTYSWDWIKHWALINELASHDWPLSLDLRGSTHHLRYYLGAYLIPALTHKLAPAIPVSMAFCAWIGIGYFLVLRVISGTTTRKHGAWLAVALLLMMGGADFYAEHLYRLAHGLPSLPYLGLHYENWAFSTIRLPLEYSSILVGLLWVPHQSIATFLVAGMLILQRDPKGLPAAILGFGLLSLWSPYGMIGLLPLMIVIAWRHRGTILQRSSWLSMFSGVGFSLIMVCYLSSDMPEAGACLTCLFDRALRLDNFILFWLVELGIFILILRSRMISDVACLISFITLLVLPLLYGNTPDFVMRASLGPLFILSLRSVQTIMEPIAEKKHLFTHRALQIMALALCIPASASQIVYQKDEGAAHRNLASDDFLSSNWMHTFAIGHAYSAEDFFDICSWRYKSQYFSKERPRFVRANE